MDERANLIEAMAKAIHPLAFDELLEEAMDEARGDAVAALSAIEAMGCAVVPVAATEAMLVNAGVSPQGIEPRGGVDYLRRNMPRYYAAMLAASPYRGVQE